MKTGKMVKRILYMTLNGAAGMYLVLLAMGIDSLSMDQLWKSILIASAAVCWILFYIRVLMDRT